MRERALIGILLLPLLFVLFSPVYSYAQDDSDMLDELERLLEGDFDFDDERDEYDPVVEEDEDLFEEVDVIMRERSNIISVDETDEDLDAGRRR